MTRRASVVGIVVAVLGVAACAAHQPEPKASQDELPPLSAARLGPHDEADELAEREPPPAEAAPAPAPEDEHYLTPAEREALAAQGYEPAIDDRVVTQTRIQPAEHTPPKGPVGRALDHIGRGFVAVASVAVVIGMAVAPFLLF